jgi:hypothetical protein
MNLSQSLSHFKGEWHRGIGTGFQVVTLLITLVASLLLTRAYIRRRNSVLQSLQGPPSSSFIFGGFMWYTFATYTRLSRQHRK